MPLEIAAKLWFFLGLVAFPIVLLICDVLRHRYPLEPHEVLQLAQKRQRNAALFEYRFSTAPMSADVSEKKAMKAHGEFLVCDFDYFNAPARIAGLLKYKKHEWIVVALIASKKVVRLWWNKGPDGTQVWSLLDDRILQEAIRFLNPDTIAFLHNHPNSNPSSFRMNSPSETDLRTARYRHRQLGGQGVNVLEFICERGMPHLYYAGFVESLVPTDAVRHEISQANSSTLFRNYRLRKELKRITQAEKVPGG